MHEELNKFCPNCEPIFHRKKSELQVGVQLEVLRDNYSGCGVDHCRCPNCQEIFQVSYKVDEITPLSNVP